VYCSKCGSTIADGSPVCSHCGQATLPGPVVATNPALVTATSPAPVMVAPGTRVAVPGVTYAGFWLRVLAYLIDAIILGVLGIPILIGAAMIMGVGGMLAGIPRGGHPFEDGMPPVFFLFIWFCVLLAVGGTWLYHALLESSEWGGTAGKKALGLVVTDLNGQRVSFARATGRHFGKIVTSFIPLGIGYAMAGFTEKRQTLHDMLASCLVLRKGQYRHLS
jgi:uncharacterized RDD family membrane protein YckC